MLGNHGRSIPRAVFTPLARLLAKAGVTPNMVTAFGTAATIAVAFGVVAQGWIWQGGTALAVIMFGDSVDGTLARMTTGGTRFGAFFDSTLDRLGDGAVFSSLTYYAVFHMEEGTARTWAVVAGLASIVGAAAVPYARARAESVGVIAKLGIAERTDRLIIAMGSAMIMDLGASAWVFVAGLTWVAVASFITVGQRVWYTARHIDEAEGA
ncbi:MAG: CDP-alcohol phosphatidyltransferase family protein [Schaalia georgiae]|uniref:Phosphatidylinositol phosphate synthase n=1 Tax=Schaalia georgiae TaxID=52768 RepID=A0A929MYP8_9ACTO|nr:CDP-alcohol phosphatidyltransferase family protein [Schaalia georgiae]